MQGDIGGLTAHADETITFIAGKVDGQGKIIATLDKFSDEIDVEVVPSQNLLFQNYPNSFSSQTTIAYHVALKENVRLNIYDIQGHIVKTLVNKPQDAGEYKVVWRGDNDYGEQVASGIYFYNLTLDSYAKTKKMVRSNPSFR